MYIVLGFNKGEAFAIGYTASRNVADKWAKAHPNGMSDEYAYVEVQPVPKLDSKPVTWF